MDETKKDNVIFTDWNRSWPSYGVLVSVPARLHTKSSVVVTVVVAYVGQIDSRCGCKAVPYNFQIWGKV